MTPRGRLDERWFRDTCNFMKWLVIGVVAIGTIIGLVGIFL